jgi:replication factor C subunit 3/5
VIVIHEADQMGTEAQNALRRTMERYSRSCRLILCATSACRLIPAIRSRCFQLRVPLPQRAELIGALQQVAQAEQLVLPGELAERIADASEGNARKAILMLEAARAKQFPLVAEQPVDKADWEEFIATIATEITQEQTPKRCVTAHPASDYAEAVNSRRRARLQDARMKVYELLAHCIPPDVILKKLCGELLRKIDFQLQYEVVNWAAFYEHRVHQGTKPIYHIEAFMARFMSLYNKFLLESFA